MARKFEHFLATRNSVLVWLALIGASGSGKTYSALRLASGMTGILGGKVWLIDTEARRALHYADVFKFNHVPFAPPFGSSDYLDAVRHCVEQGAKVVIVDSMSHEHEGEGGYLAFHESELDRMAGDDTARRDRASMAAWVRPSAARNRMLLGLAQLQVSIIFCFRAKERTKPLKGANGKVVPTELGWSAIGGDSLIYEMTASCLLPPHGQGVPQWHSDFAGELSAMKLPQQFVGLLNRGGALSEEIGASLANWATGNPIVADGDASPDVDLLDGFADSGLGKEYREPYRLLAGAALHGTKVLSRAWERIDSKSQRALKRALDERFKPRAAQQD
jgi:AAA domain